jgi:hypothetical protein
MPTTVKNPAKGLKAVSKSRLSEKKKKNNHDKTSTSSNDKHLSSSSASHQQHHSAPPSQHNTSKPGLQAIRENAEEPTSQFAHGASVSNVVTRVPRSSTVPYPVYATLRTVDGALLPHFYPYSDSSNFVHGTFTSTQINNHLINRQPFSSLDTNFQPISPQRQHYSSRPVDILKPTFLIVPKQAEQRLSNQLLTSTSPNTNKHTDSMPKKTEKKSSTPAKETPSPPVRSVEVQTNENAPAQTNNETSIPATHQHIGILATPNPSPYVHFVTLPYAAQSPPILYEGPPESSILQEEFTQLNEYSHPSGSIRSMPNIAMTQGEFQSSCLDQN